MDVHTTTKIGNIILPSILKIYKRICALFINERICFPFVRPIDFGVTKPDIILKTDRLESSIPFLLILIKTNIDKIAVNMVINSIRL